MAKTRLNADGVEEAVPWWEDFTYDPTGTGGYGGQLGRAKEDRAKNQDPGVAQSQATDFETRLKKYKGIAASIRSLSEIASMAPGKAALLTSGPMRSLLSPAPAYDEAATNLLIEKEAKADYGRK